MVSHLANDCRYAMQASTLRGSPAPLSGNELKSLPSGSNHDGLNHACRADGLSEFLEAVLAETGARLVRIGVNQVNVNLAPARRSGRFTKLGTALRFRFPNQGAQSPAQCVSRHWQ